MLASLLLIPATLLAQTGTSSISGRVSDPQGQVVPGATVTLASNTTGTVRTALSNESGLYQFLSMPPGVYEMTIELTGFKTAKFQQVELRVDTPQRQDVKLEVGGLTEAVTVLAESPMVNRLDASLGNAISREQIRNLPIEALNVVHLLSLQPGAVFIPTRPNLVLGDAGFNDPRNGAANGARADQQTVRLDGVDVNDSQTQQAYTSVLRMTSDALQEFKLSTSNYGAEMGRSSGPQVSLVTRSGGNSFTGSAYEFLR